MALAGSSGVGRVFAEEAAPSAIGAGSCRLISQDVTGPFHTEHYLDRSNLMDGQNGVPLTLNFHVKDVLTCKPLAGAKVLIWHTNNEGHYSGVVNQVLNADGTPHASNGRATIEDVFPLFNAFEGDMSAGLSVEQKQALAHHLRRVITNATDD